MKLAVIADIHGNLNALQAVLADAKAQGAQQFAFLGDYYMSLHQPNQCVEAVREIPGAIAVRGNHEDYLKGLETQGKTDGQMQMLYWASDALTTQNRQWMCNLPDTATLAVGETMLFFAHSSAVFMGQAEHREFSSAKFAQRYKDNPPTRQELLADIEQELGTDVDFLDALETMAQGVYLFGHSHMQWHVDFDGRIFVNPGACGLPTDMQQGAPYTILEIGSGQVKVKERRVQYDIGATKIALLESTMYQQTPIWAQIIAKELEDACEYAVPFLHFAQAYAQKIGDTTRPFSQQTWAAAYHDWKKAENT